MKNIQNNSSKTAIGVRRVEARSFAHHYGAVTHAASSERALRVYPPLGWGNSQVLPHVRRTERAQAERLDELHLTRTPLTL